MIKKTLVLFIALSIFFTGCASNNNNVKTGSNDQNNTLTVKKVALNALMIPVGAVIVAGGLATMIVVAPFYAATEGAKKLINYDSNETNETVVSSLDANINESVVNHTK